MPELPEVETLRRQLQPVARGQKITNVQVFEPRLRFPVDQSFSQTLKGQIIADVARRGKYLLFHLRNESVWLVHLGMSGRLLWSGLDHKYFTHISWEVGLENDHSMVYSDARRFGFTRIFPAGQSYLDNLGPEPLERGWNSVYLQEKLCHKTRDIKNILMDQAVVAGIGNIYANEILFHAQIHPLKPGNELNGQNIEDVIRASRKVLREAIRFQGTSISDFLNMNGKQGRFQKRFFVYARSGLACKTCGQTIQKDKNSGRSFFYCPQCQQ